MSTALYAFGPAVTAVWLTPDAPSALAVLRLPSVALPPLLDRPLPPLGRARFARVVDRAGRVIDEGIISHGPMGFDLTVHGGTGMRSAVHAALATWGIACRESAHGTVPATAWDELAAAAHPAAVAWLLAHPQADRTALPARFRQFLYRHPRVLIVGPANAGKSTLLNAWSGRERALVSTVPGTTRDLVSAEILVRGWRLDVTDSAGLRATDDALERAGQTLVAAARQRADLVLWLDDPDASRTAETAGAPAPDDLVVLGKNDLRPAGPGLRWSAQQPERLDDLASAVLARLGLLA